MEDRTALEKVHEKAMKMVTGLKGTGTTVPPMKKDVQSWECRHWKGGETSRT
jgi:hypothetical protein